MKSPNYNHNHNHKLLTGTTVVGENPSTRLKRTPQISKVAKFESEFLKTNEDITSQICRNLQTFVWYRARTPPPPPVPLAPKHTNVCKISRLCSAISSLCLDLYLLNLTFLISRRSARDHCMFLVNCPPTPPLNQLFALSEK